MYPRYIILVHVLLAKIRKMAKMYIDYDFNLCYEVKTLIQLNIDTKIRHRKFKIKLMLDSVTKLEEIVEIDCEEISCLRYLDKILT